MNGIDFFLNKINIQFVESEKDLAISIVIDSYVGPIIMKLIKKSLSMNSRGFRAGLSSDQPPLKHHKLYFLKT